MKAYQVDAPTKAIMGIQFRDVLIGQGTQHQVVGRADARAECIEIGLCPAGAFPSYRLAQRRIGGVEIAVREVGGYVGDFMGFRIL